MSVAEVVEVSEYVKAEDIPGLEWEEGMPFPLGTRVGPEFDEEGSTVAWIASLDLVMIYSLKESSGKRRVLRSKIPIYSIRLGKCRDIRLPWKAVSQKAPENGYLILATGLRNGYIKLYDASTCVLLTNLLSHTFIVSDIAFQPVKNGPYTQIVSVSMDKSLKVWDQEENGYNMSQTIATQDPLLTVAWSPNGRYVASAGIGRVVYLLSGFEKDAVSVRKKLRGHFEAVVSIQFSPDSALIFSASYDTRIHVWDVETGTIRQTLCHTYPVPLLVFSNHVTSLCVNSLGTFAASVCNEGDNDGRLRLWDLEGFKDSPITNNPDSRKIVRQDRKALSCTLTRNNLLAVLDESRNVSLYNVTSSPPSLKHACRIKVLSIIHHRADLASLEIPRALLRYLTYEVWK